MSLAQVSTLSVDSDVISRAAQHPDVLRRVIALVGVYVVNNFERAKCSLQYALGYKHVLVDVAVRVRSRMLGTVEASVAVDSGDTAFPTRTLLTFGSAETRQYDRFGTGPDTGGLVVLGQLAACGLRDWVTCLAGPKCCPALVSPLHQTPLVARDKTKGLALDVSLLPQVVLAQWRELTAATLTKMVRHTAITPVRAYGTISIIGPVSVVVKELLVL